jgi:hypothetical protein
MYAIRDEGKADQETRRWCVLRGLTVTLVLIALALAGASKADTQPFRHHSPHGDISMPHDLVPDGEHCCIEAEPEQTDVACTALGHCVGCTLGSAAVAEPPRSSEALLLGRLTTLPGGREAGPAGHPPKAS